MRHSPVRACACLAFLCAVTAAAALAPPDAAAGKGRLAAKIWTVSADPRFVSGGDVLVRVRTSAGRPRVLLNGRNVSARFKRSSPRVFTALLTDLRTGANTIKARSRNVSRGRWVTLKVTNWPSSGPIISGPHSAPFFCQTEASGLGPARDADCTVTPTFSYWYKSKASPPVDSVPLDLASASAGFRPLSDPARPYPPDVDVTTTSEGRTVPFIVRVESGVVNRGIYHIAILDDPHRRAGGSPYRPTVGWNRNLVHQFGGNCSAGAHVSGAAEPDSVLHEPFLRRGYAVAMNTLNIFGVSCNEVVSAEALMMTKERFIERYAPVRHTIGAGASGGAIQQQMIATQYPGLLDGLMTSLSFPDLWSALGRPVLDCFLLERQFARSPLAWTQDKKQAVTGMSVNGCDAWNAVFYNSVGGLALPHTPADGAGGVVGREVTRADARGGCDAAIPRRHVYEARQNPGGIRCTLQDAQINILGRDPATGFAYLPYDNVGVQYGLQALNARKITKRDFLDINAQVGGFDVDGNPVDRRTAMKAPANVVRAWYAQGRVTSGSGGLPQVPIIDRNLWANNFEVHHSVFSHFTRNRLLSSNGTDGNQVLWIGPAGARSSIDGMERWLDNVDRDTEAGSRAAKVLRNRPADIHDDCTTEGMPEIDGKTCDALFAPYGTPQLIAGASPKQDVLQCRLKPPDPGDYAVTFTDEEWRKLHAVFASGVCDWRVPGVGQVPLAGTWISYGPACSTRTSGRPVLRGAGTPRGWLCRKGRSSATGPGPAPIR